MKIICNEKIFAEGGFSCHSSTFEFLSDGGITAAWFQGTAEGADDVCIFVARKIGGTWSKSERVTPDDGEPHWNPVLHLEPDGTLFLFYKTGKHIAGWRTMAITSADGGVTWSPPFELVPGDMSGGRGPVRNKPVYMRGTLLAPASTEKSEWKCFIDRRTADGVWRRGDDIALPLNEKARGIIQPTLWLDDTGVHALMRSTEGYIYRADSEDGEHWTEPYPTALPNNNSGIDIASADGVLYLACNPVGLPEGSRWGERTPLSIMSSKDGGAVWELYTNLETGEGSFAYPALRYREGCLHLSYTYNRKTIRYMKIEI